MRAQKFCLEATVKLLDEAIVGRLAWPREVERDTALVGLQISRRIWPSGPLARAKRQTERFIIYRKKFVIMPLLSGFHQEVLAVE